MQASIFFDRVRRFLSKLLCYYSSKRTVSVQKTARSDSMKRKNICAEAALREVARKNHTTVEEVRKEIRLAMIAAMCNPDPAIQKRWNASCWRHTHAGGFHYICCKSVSLKTALRISIVARLGPLLIPSSLLDLEFPAPESASADSPPDAAGRRR